jgi:protein dithiol:quinone oxidoreductase
VFSTSLSRLLQRPRLLAALVALAALCLIAAALTVQSIDHLEPCPLCILQRYAFTLVALFAALAAVLSGRAALASAALGVVSALSGAGVAAWHVRLQLFPPEEASCGPSLQYLLTNLPLGRALPRIFQGYADCTQVDWTFLRLSMPAWALLWLIGLGALLFVAARRITPGIRPRMKSRQQPV